nr:PREDICTED: E3 ubiquitin-protein ligase ZNRF2 [Bos mutus]
MAETLANDVGLVLAFVNGLLTIHLFNKYLPEGYCVPSIAMSGVVKENWALSVDQCQLQVLQLLVHLIDLMNILLRCVGLAGIHKAVVDQTDNRPPISDRTQDRNTPSPSCKKVKTTHRQVQRPRATCRRRGRLLVGVRRSSVPPISAGPAVERGRALQGRAGPETCPSPNPRVAAPTPPRHLGETGREREGRSEGGGGARPVGGGPGGPRLVIGSLPAHLSPHMFGGFKCPVCSKFVPSDEMDLHLVMCLTKPRITYNEDVLSKDAGECAICLEELQQGDTIARLPCLCIYHKGCIDEWFEVNRSCPEHPSD